MYQGAYQLAEVDASERAKEKEEEGGGGGGVDTSEIPRDVTPNISSPNHRITQTHDDNRKGFFGTRDVPANVKQMCEVVVTVC